jgi:hypothetical protein
MAIVSNGVPLNPHAPDVDVEEPRELFKAEVLRAQKTAEESMAELIRIAQQEAAKASTKSTPPTTTKD